MPFKNSALRRAHKQQSPTWGSVVTYAAGNLYLPRSVSLMPPMAFCTLPFTWSPLPSDFSLESPNTLPATSFTLPLACLAEPLMRSLSMPASIRRHSISGTSDQSSILKYPAKRAKWLRRIFSGCSSSRHRLEKLFVLPSGDSPLLAGGAIVLNATALAGFGRIPPRLPTSRQLLDCCLQRSGSIVIIIPHVAALDKRRPCSHSEAFSIQACLHLRPGDRHRNRRAQSSARGQRRDCRRLSVIAKIVEEYFARPLAL